MSETTTPAGQTAIPGFSTRAFTTSNGGETYPAVEVTFGVSPPRSVIVRNPDMADQFDLVEIGGDSAENTTWMSMAIIAASVESVDGVPVLRVKRREDIRAIIKRLGADGMAAAARGINAMQAAPEVDHADAAKN